MPSIVKPVNARTVPLKSGLEAISDEIVTEFPFIPNVWGTSTFPDHNTGECLDFMIRNRAQGDQIVAYLRSNAKRLGIKGIIWNRHVYGYPSNGTAYRGPEGQARPYGGTNPHTDHVHIQAKAGFKASTASPTKKPARGYEPAAREIYADKLHNAVKAAPRNSDSVYWWQRILNAISFPNGKEIGCTGTWTAETTAETKKAQKSIGDKQDGWPGPKQIEYVAEKAKHEVGSLSIYKDSDNGGLLHRT